LGKTKVDGSAGAPNVTPEGDASMIAGTGLGCGSGNRQSCVR